MAADFSGFEASSGGSDPVAGHGQSIDEETASVAGGSQWNPLTAAALVGGAVAATASGGVESSARSGLPSVRSPAMPIS